MIYILEDLMTLRKHREKLALNRMLQARKALEEAKDAAEKRANELSDFIQWRKNEENRLFEEIKKKLQKLNHLDDYNQRVDALRQEQNNLKEKLDQVEQRVIQIEDEVKKANEKYTLRHREKKKLEEHRKNWWLNKTVIDQRNEENEIDELGTMRFNTVRSS